MDLMYVSSSNPVTPDIFQLADQNKGLDEKARAQASQPLNADITGVSHVLAMLDSNIAPYVVCTAVKFVSNNHTCSVWLLLLRVV